MQSKGKQRRAEINISGTVVMRTTLTSSVTQWKRSELDRTIIKSTTKQRWSSRRLEVTRLPASRQVFHTDAETTSPKFTRKKFDYQIYTRETQYFGRKHCGKGDVTWTDISIGLDGPKANETLYFRPHIVHTQSELNNCENVDYIRCAYTVNIHLKCTRWSTTCETSNNIVVKYKQQTVETTDIKQLMIWKGMTSNTQ